MLMRRTQVYIDQPTYKKARLFARARGKTISELIRTSLIKSLEKERSANPLELINQFNRKYKSPIDTPKNLSTTLDKYLYTKNT